VKSRSTNASTQENADSRLTRRELMTAVTSSVLLSLPAPGVAAVSAEPAPQEPSKTSYDLLIKGGKVIDPAQNMEAPMDIAIQGGKIARVAQDIPASQARQVLDAVGKVVTPGLIDVHFHAFPYVNTGIDADPSCVTRGVTTAVDAGTSGALSFPAFKHLVMDKVKTRVRSLLHIVSIGMVGSQPSTPELGDLRFCDPKLAAKVASENRDNVLGFKIRIERTFTVPGSNDIEAMKRVRAAADETRLPLMIHIGGSYTPLKDFLALMKEGDVVTHVYNPRENSVLDKDGKLLPEVLDARSRGVKFDIGHGRTNLSYRIAEQCMRQQFLPDTISSDLGLRSKQFPVFDLVTTMSKFLLLGLSMREVVARTTLNAARMFNFGTEIGTLRPGAEADVAVFELREGKFELTDADNDTRVGKQKIIPVATVRGGEIFYPVGMPGVTG
jgi:dihydroorotase